MYIHLISTASADKFDNDLSSFGVELSSALHLEGTWEVGLVEAVIPYNMDMVRGTECNIECIRYQRNSSGDYDVLGLVHEGPLQSTASFCGFSISYVRDHYEVELRSGFICRFAGEKYGLPDILFGDTGRTIKGMKVAERKLEGTLRFDLVRCVMETVTVREGYYHEFSDLAFAINEAIGADGNFEVDKNSGFFKFTSAKDALCVFQLSDKLTNIAGFRGESQPLQLTTAKHFPDRYPGFNAFLLHCSILDSTHVGHVKVPLLQILPVKNNMKYGDLMQYEIANVMYKKVKKSNISAVHTSIYNDVGEKVRFGDRGHVILTLHFRHVKS
jgi:hypothetical protein